MSDYGFLPEKIDITITCASGIEKVLKSELIRLGVEDAPAVNGALTFQGSPYDIARCNLCLRTADRVYVKVGEFNALSFDELFDGVAALDWENYLPSNAKILVNGKCVKSKLFAVSACQSVIQKAIIERLCKRHKVNRLDFTGSTYAVEFSIYKDTASIMINTSGAGLHKRGYRDLVGIAPIKETLASGLLLLSDFYKTRPFADPFCGSGTIAIEAARIAMNIGGGVDRKFAFNDWKNFDNKVFDLAYQEVKDKENRNIELEILASDIDPKAVKLARRHAERAGVADKIRFEVKDVKNFTTDLKNGTIVTNPPYGQRVYDRDEAAACYKSLGKVVKELDGWSTFVITSAKNFEKCFGKKADRNRKLFNSNRECKYYYYYGKKEI